MIEADRTPFHRVRIVLTARQSIRLHVHQAGLVYALLAAAFGRSLDRADVLPDGLMLDAPEVGRGCVARGEPFALGFTLLADEPEHASRVLAAVVDGLLSVGMERPERPLAFAGNFEVTEVRDLVRGDEWSEGRSLECVPRSTLETEATKVAACEFLTLRFS